MGKSIDEDWRCKACGCYMGFIDIVLRAVMILNQFVTTQDAKVTRLGQTVKKARPGMSELMIMILGLVTLVFWVGTVIVNTALLAANIKLYTEIVKIRKLKAKESQTGDECEKI